MAPWCPLRTQPSTRRCRRACPTAWEPGRSWLAVGPCRCCGGAEMQACQVAALPCPAPQDSPTCRWGASPLVVGPLQVRRYELVAFMKAFLCLMVLLDTSGSASAAFAAVLPAESYPMLQVLVVAAAQLHLGTLSFRAACAGRGMGSRGGRSFEAPDRKQLHLQVSC